MERKLGSRTVSITQRGRRKFRKVSDYVYDIPLLSSIKQLLSDPVILEEIIFM